MTEDEMDEACFDATMDVFMEATWWTEPGFKALETEVARLVDEYSLEMVRGAFIGHQVYALDQALAMQRLLNGCLVDLAGLCDVHRAERLASQN